MRVSAIPAVAEACTRLTAWRERLDFERPFEFYADVLYAEGGLRRLHARLGGEVDDVIAEFLDLALRHEQADQPSLLGFLAEMRSREVEIKRELAEAGAGVRVMTVHGAKGLEAPIVILADAAQQARRAARPSRPLFRRGERRAVPLSRLGQGAARRRDAARSYQAETEAARWPNTGASSMSA